MLDYGSAPGVTGVTVAEAPGGDGGWDPGDTVEVRLTFAEPVVVDTAEGRPTVGLLAGSPRTAAYARGSGTPTLVFAWTLGPSEARQTFVLVTPDSLALNGGTIRGTGGLAVNLEHVGTAVIGVAQPELAVEDAQVTEAAGAMLQFAVRLSGAATQPVAWATADGTATAGADYEAGSGTLTFALGERAHTLAVQVLNDVHNEGSETLKVTLSEAVGARIGDGEATGTIQNSDPLPAAWLARFGRTAAEQVRAAVEERLAAAAPGGAAQASVAGRPLSVDQAAHERAVEDYLSASLLSVHPYLGLTLHERLRLWGLLGYGLLGELELDPAAGEAMRTDLGLLLGALLAAGPGGRPGAGGEGRRPAAAHQLRRGARTGGAVLRSRLLLEAAYRDIPLFGGALSPALEAGVRYDDGDAERGAGLVVGGGVEYRLPAAGLSLSGRAQGLLLHEDAGFSEWGVALRSRRAGARAGAQRGTGLGCRRQRRRARVGGAGRHPPGARRRPARRPEPARSRAELRPAGARRTRPAHPVRRPHARSRRAPLAPRQPHARRPRPQPQPGSDPPRAGRRHPQRLPDPQRHPTPIGTAWTRIGLAPGSPGPTL